MNSRITLFSLLIALFLACPTPGHALFSWLRSDSRVDYNPPTAEETARASDIFERGLRHFEEGRYRRAISTLRRISLDYSNTAFAAEALFITGEAQLARERPAAAFDAFQRIIDRYPDYPRFDTVLSRQFEIASFIMANPRGTILFVFPGFSKRESAIRFFESVAKNAPYSDLAPLALMNLAIVAEEKGDDERAIDALDRIITFYPRSDLTEDAYFALARIFSKLITGPEYDQGSTLEAINYFEDFLILFPRSLLVAEAEEGLRDAMEIFARSRLLIGEFYYVNRNATEAAKVFYNEAITVAPNSQAAELARERIARIEAGKPRPRLRLSPAETRERDSGIFDFFQDRFRQRNEEIQAGAG